MRGTLLRRQIRSFEALYGLCDSFEIAIQRVEVSASWKIERFDDLLDRITHDFLDDPGCEFILIVVEVVVVHRVRISAATLSDKLAKSILEIAETVRRVVDALANRAVERVTAAREDLRQERVGRIFLGAFVVYENLGQRDLSNVLARLVVDDANFRAFVE
jgi:hypothetical protein